MTVAFTDRRVHPASAPFYAMFPWEPVRSQGEINVERVVEVDGLRMEWLLEQIPVEVDVGGNLVIIYHGTEMGLSMPLATDSQVQAEVRIMEVLNSERTAIEAAQICLIPDPRGTGAQRIRKLREKIRRVQDLRINCIELRACNIGRRDSSMRTIKQFFNCRILGAPDRRDSFFFLDPGSATTNIRIWRNWQRSYPRHRIFDVPANGRVGIAIRETARSRFDTYMIVNQPSAPSFWADAYIAFLHPHSVGMSRFPGHALYDTTPDFPLIFPGDSSYTRHIVHV